MRNRSTDNPGLSPLWLVWVRWALTRAGYVARPYDPHSDARCWRWQRTRCRVVVVQLDNAGLSR